MTGIDEERQAAVDTLVAKQEAISKAQVQALLASHEVDTSAVPKSIDHLSIMSPPLPDLAISQRPPFPIESEGECEGRAGPKVHRFTGKHIQDESAISGESIPSKTDAVMRSCTTSSVQLRGSAGDELSTYGSSEPLKLSTAPRKELSALVELGPRKRSRDHALSTHEWTSPSSGARVASTSSAMTVSSSKVAATGVTSRMPNLSSDNGPIRKKSKASNPTTSDSACPAMCTLNCDPTNGLPGWYVSAKKPAKLKFGQRSTWYSLKAVRDLVRKCQELSCNESEPTPTQTQKQKQAFSRLYDEIDNVRSRDVEPWGLKSANLLDNEAGLPQIFDKDFTKGVEYPHYIVTDAQGLYKRWTAEIWEGSNIFRGIDNMIKQDKKDGKGPSINAKYKVDWRFFGHGHLVNGDWFANQICAVRDGAHGSLQGGISGIAGQGATSIMISGTRYEDADKDDGENIWYSGTVQKKKAEEVTQRTQLLRDNLRTRMPVRVLRSMNAPKANKFKPSAGLRYDGLYMVLDEKVLNAQAQHFLFHLIRLPSQDPIRSNGEGQRPSEREIATYRQEMQYYGKRQTNM